MSGARYTAVILVLAISATAAIGTATATAENPEILPNPTTKMPLTFTGTGGAGKLETTKGLIITCGKVAGSGSFTSANLGTSTLNFSGCKGPLNGTFCNSIGDEKAVILVNSGVHLVDYKVGTELLLGAVVSFTTNLKLECSLLKNEVAGAVIGKVTGVTHGAKTKAAKLIYKETKGEQELTACELDKTFCAKGPFKLEANLGGGFELAGGEVEVGLTFGSEFAVEF